VLIGFVEGIILVRHEVFQNRKDLCLC